MSHNKIVLMACGSFSPPTFMHLRMFEIARDYIHSMGMGMVIGGIVSPVHDAYGKKDLVAAHHRISMLRLALQSSSWVRVSEWETQQPGWTRTRLSLEYHQDAINGNTDSHSWLPPPARADIDDVNNVNNINNINNNNNNASRDVADEAPRRRDAVVRLLCGADLLESFATPGLWADDDLEAILGHHGLVVVTRAGSDPQKFIYESDLLHKYRRNITLVPNHIADCVSSTALRRLLRRGLSAKYLTDDGVLQYVARHRLYAATGSVVEYNSLSDLIDGDRQSPTDVAMTSPDEQNFKNILISIRDRPSIVDETITVKRPRRSNFLRANSRTDLVAPLYQRPAAAYGDKGPPSVPGRPVKIHGDGSHTLGASEVSDAHSSLDSFLSTAGGDHRRRVSDGNVNPTGNVSAQETIKKRCSSTVRKMTRAVDIKKSKSEVAKLCDKVRNVKIRESARAYKTRSCNDIVRSALTRRGIQVLSDTEAIV